MTAIRVEVTAEQIAAAAGAPHYEAWCRPLEKALEAIAPRQLASIDRDGGGYIATVGQGAWTLVFELPDPIVHWLDYRSGYDDLAKSDPIAFDLEVPDWIVGLVSRAVLAADGLA